jgi:hypothetical protein
MRKLAVLLMGLLIGAVGVAAPVAASPYPPNGATLTTSSSSPLPGGRITITAEGFCPGSTVELAIKGPGSDGPTQPIGSYVADGTGKVIVEIDAPLTPGSYQIIATSNGPGQECAKSLSIPIRVRQQGTPGTGSDSGTLLLAGLVAVGVGGALVLVARLRRRPATA